MLSREGVEEGGQSAAQEGMQESAREKTGGGGTDGAKERVRIRRAKNGVAKDEAKDSSDGVTGDNVEDVVKAAAAG
jgi:hypothetical protein